MELLKYIIISIIQGLTETIPVSSSGHLMIIKNILNLNIDFDDIAIITNFGSLIAIIILFRKDICSIIGDFFKYIFNRKEEYKENYKYAWFIGIGCIPAGLMGLLFNKFDILNKIEDNIKVIGISLIVTSILLFIIRNFKGTKNESKMRINDALTVGVFQILGLLPGISRSGSTIVGGMVSGLSRNAAFKYSFMLYIPLSICAFALEIFDITFNKELIFYYIVSIIISTIVTLLVTKWFRKIVNDGKLIYFSIYCLIVGLLVILFI